MPSRAVGRQTGPAAQQILEVARSQIIDLDAQLIRLVWQRMKAAQVAGDAKRALGLPCVDFHREQAVIDRVRANARLCGLDEEVAERLVSVLIESSVDLQDIDRLQAGTVRGSAVVVGAGRMGTWLLRFLRDAGYGATLVLPEAEEACSALRSASLIFVALPAQAVAKLYDAWSAAPPPGIIVDVASVKDPLIPALRRLQKAGARVSSLHPLFGSNRRTLRGMDVVVCDTGDPEAASAVTGLFAGTSARVVPIGIEDHDATIAVGLARAHAAVIAYGAAASDMGASSYVQKELQRLVDFIRSEDPAVYFELQRATVHHGGLEAHQASLAVLRDVVANEDEAGFGRVVAEPELVRPERAAGMG